VAIYLDSSALVKLVVREPESRALRRYLARRPDRVTCALARVEVVRAVRGQGVAAIARARQLLERVGLLGLDQTLLDAAAGVDAEHLRTLDAIHLAAAATLGDSLSAIVTYDLRMARAASELGLGVDAPN
jgi:uncharacterized protein